MFPKETLSTFVTEMHSRIPPPVHTAGIQENRPVPAVLIENIDLENKNHHNSHYAGSDYDDFGTETTQRFRYYYTLTLTLAIRDDDEVGAYGILGDVQKALSNIARNPVDELHNDVHEVRILGSGPVTYQFIEPTETELKQSVALETFYETTDSDLDVIESMNDSIDVI